MTKNGMSVNEAVGLWNELVTALGTSDPNEMRRKEWKFPNGACDKIIGLWYDWFCADSQLVFRGLKLLKKLSAIASSPKFDPDRCYVFFKNNCPIYGPTYDDFRIVDDETRDVQYTVSSNLWGVDNDFNEPLAHGFVKIKKFFGV